MSRILITGGAGFIGSNLAEGLSKNPEHQITVVDDLSTGHREFVPQADNVQFIEADVNDYGQIASVFESPDGEPPFDYIYHYAAVVGVERTQKHPDKVLHDVHGIENIGRLAVQNHVKRILFSSSSEVYGEPVEMPQKEDTTPLNSQNPYSVVKAYGEQTLIMLHKLYGIDYTVLRFFNAYGPRQSDDFVVPKFLAAAMAGEDIGVRGDGSKTRTFCYVDDNVAATIAALDNHVAANKIINIGNDNEIHIIDLAKKIIEITGSSSRIVEIAELDIGVDMTKRRPDITKMKTLLLLRPLVTLDEGIQRLIEYKTKNT